MSHQDIIVNFQVAAIVNPNGFKPGLYYFVEYLGGGMPRKVSRYLTSAKVATQKAVMYEAKHDAGDRYWPAVTREDELRDSQYVVETESEKLSRLLREERAAAKRVLPIPTIGERVVVEFTEDELRNLHAVLYGGIVATADSKVGKLRDNLGQVIALAYGDTNWKSYGKATVVIDTSNPRRAPVIFVDKA